MSLSLDKKAWSESCEQNKAPILAVLQAVLPPAARVLEIGSGTGQHAVWFGRHLAGVDWQPSDRDEHLAGIRAWLAEADLDTVRAPLALDVLVDPWPATRFEAVFSANTAHIMSWSGVEAMFTGVAQVLADDCVFCLYGPFSYHGRHTSPSNASFDQWLKQRDPDSGVRDLTALTELAAGLGLVLEQDIEMPVNNRTLVWRRPRT